MPPFGSVRFPIERAKRVLLGGCSAGEYHSDLGIVLSLTESVYGEFLSAQLENNAVEFSGEGYVEFFSPPDELPRAPQPTALVHTKANEIDIGTLSMPRFVVRIDSPLQVKFQTHSNHPRFNAWFVRPRVYREPGRVIGLGGRARGKEPPFIYSDPLEYEYFYCPVLRNDPDEMEMVREIFHCNFFGMTVTPTREFDTARLLRISKAHQLKPEDYAVLDVRNLTEFDTRTPVGAPLVSLMGGPSPEKLSYLSEIRELEKGIAKSHPDMVNHKKACRPNKAIDSDEE